MIGRKEALLLLRREMADLDDGVHMLRGNRRLVGRIGDLGDEAAVLAEGFGERDVEKKLPVTEEVAANTMFLPIYPGLTEAEQDRVIAALKNCLARGNQG